MEFNEKLIDDLAGKLLIGLSREENKNVLDEFNIIKENMDLINKIPNIKDVKPATHPYDLYVATLRSDEVGKQEEFKDIIKNCDDYEGREIKVPKTV